MNDVREKIRDFIVENFLFDEPDILKDNLSLLDEGILDSTGILELVGFVEEEFGITVEDDELSPENLDSIDNVVSFINRKQASAATAA